MEASPRDALGSLRADAIRAARIRLASNYDLESVDPGEYYIEAWRLKVGLPTSEHLLVKIPHRFPLVLPHIYLDRLDKFGVISHVTRRGRFCYFEEEAVTYDFEQIADVVEHAVSRSIEALSEPDYLGTEDEFRKEILAYLDTRGGNFLSLLDDYSTLRSISLTVLKENEAGYAFLVANSEEEATTWLNRTGLAKAERQSLALFIPEAIVGRPPFALTLRELATDMKAISNENFSFFAKNYRQIDTCVTTVASSLGITVVAWKYPMSRFADPGRAPSVHGFRPGKYPPKVELSSDYADTLVKYFKGDRIDTRRLVERTEPSLMEPAQSRVVIVGLGAIGSNLARLLPKAAICSHLALFDKEKLAVENILRHASSFRFVGFQKTIPTFIESHSHAPWTEVVARGDAITEIGEFERVCKKASHVILATGSERVDSFLAKVAYDHVGVGSVVTQIWLEERAEIGRVVCYAKGDSPCPSCAKVGRKTMDLSEGTQEPGCNASYANYGGSRLQRFCATSLDYILNSKRTLRLEWRARSGDVFSVDTCQIDTIEREGCDQCG